MPLLSKLAMLARSPQGRRAVNKAVTYARSPEGKERLRTVRERVAKQRRRPPA